MHCENYFWPADGSCWFYRRLGELIE